ncbi:papain family cysteine protease domain-containing protein [Ditylenchus destructor]|nr:papain family cysteine protease domain-containing protein [Ditylenchus destructor]
MSDRICVASKGEIQVHVSAVDLLSCCPDADGCNGAHTLDVAWKYWVSNGIVSGSNYTSKQGCKPYPFVPCGTKCSSRPEYKTPECEKKCQSSYDQKTYEEDKHYGSKFFTVPSGDVKAIQKEIYTHGSVEAAMMVYEDFVNYHDGIYTHESGEPLGGHAVKLIGWGEENGTPYWIGANSWNTDWGNKGFFRIIRGKNMVDIESQVLGGLPDLKPRKHIYHRS